MLLKDYVCYWYMTYKQPKHQKNTQETYLSYIHTHICPSSLGAMEIGEIGVGDVQGFLSELLLRGNKCPIASIGSLGKPLSHWTVTKIRQILISVFKHAVKEGMVSRNPAADTEPVSIKWSKGPVFLPEVQKKFLQATRAHRFYTAYVLLFFLGLRREEVLGLSWNQIDLRRNELSIQQVLVMEGRKPVLRECTKTRTSLRVIPFPQEIKCLLADWKKQQKEESASVTGWHNPHSLVFTNKDGSPHNPTYFSRNFKNVVKRLDFCDNRLHVHSTRHSWATNMVQSNAAITDIQSLGGWSRPDVLLNIYAHTVKKSQRRAMKKLYNDLNS